ncbi:MAG: hypothetical protein HYW48_09295 [Deltaproteobacteria bacterium]|nr:hypothetical protein [Deltaproteobacteria bacterium]
MKFTNEQLEKLMQAYASGALRVRFGEREVVYRSEEELRRAIERVAKELGKKQTVKIPRSFGSKGLT